MENPASANNDDGEIATPNDLEVSRPIPMKKILLILTSFFLALASIFIATIVLAHVHLAYTFLFQPGSISNSPPNRPPSLANNGIKSGDTLSSESSTTSSVASDKSSPKEKVPITKVKKVFVSPTAKDVERIREELETSDPLPSITSIAGENSTSLLEQIESYTSPLKTLLDEREKILSSIDEEQDALMEAYESFSKRFEQEVSVKNVAVVDDVESVKNELLEKVASLRSLLGRTSFVDLTRDDVVELFQLANDDLRFLKGKNDSVFLNTNGVLSEIFKFSRTPGSTSDDACQSFLSLDTPHLSNELELPTKSLRTKKSPPKHKEPPKIPPSPPSIPEDTARESDLYTLVSNLKQILSRRDLASVELEDDGTLPSPLSEENTEILRAHLSPMIDTIHKRWLAELENEGEMRRVWQEKIDELVRNYETSDVVGGQSGDGLSSGAGNSDDMCASPELVEQMVKSGLESFRRKENLEQALSKAIFDYIGTDSTEDDKKLIENLASKLDSLQIEFEDFVSNSDVSTDSEGNSKSSSWIDGRKSSSYILDSSLLRNGVTGWIDYAVDLISGYNDHIDSFIDWIVGDQEVSVGTLSVRALGKLLRKIPLKKEYFEGVKKSGILGGRTRSLVE